MSNVPQPSKQRRIAVGLGIAAALFALFGFIFWSNHRGGISYIPVRVEKSAKALVRGYACQPLDSESYLVVGYLEAPPDSGTIRIGAKVHFSNLGPSKASFDYSGWTTYFDTSDPGYVQYGSGTQEFVVKVDTDSSVNGVTPTFCTITASYFH